MSFAKTFYSIANLGVMFGIHMIKWPFVSRKSVGRKRYDSNYAEDRLAFFTDGEFARFDAYDRCINCGLCDAACVGAREAEIGFWSAKELNGNPLFHFRPSIVADDISRCQPVYHTGLKEAGLFEKCGGCRLCEKACPNGVPLLEIAALVKAKAIIPKRVMQRAAVG